MSSDYVQLRDLTIAYGDTVVVPGLNLDIAKGELLALLGPSGCGKTTTMRALAGLLAPVAGQIVIDGTDVTGVPANRRGIGLVFQSYALFPHLNAFENVAFGLRLRRLGAAEIDSRTQAGLASTGLAGFEKRKPAELSGGQQQRLALARALVMEPKILLLDEPLSNLDARLRLEMRNELQSMQRKTGVTMVFITHDQSEALALADRIALMRDGRIEQLGTAPELYSRPATAFAADFMGYENIFQVEGSELVSATGRLSLPYAPPDPILAWRPGGVAVGSGPHSGRVTASSFAGDRLEYALDTPLGTVKVESPLAKGRHEVGDSVAFDLPQNTAWGLRD